MAYLKRQREQVVLIFTAEFKVNVAKTDLVGIIKAILNAPVYDEETGKAFLERILAEQGKLEKLAERELLEKKAEREFELEKLRLSSALENGSFKF